MANDDVQRTKRYEGLLEKVKDSGDILSINMGELRDVHGAGKLGNIVVASIAEELKSYGLAHSPTELPTYQWRHVMVYRNGTPLAKLISAIDDVNESSADVVRQFSNASNKEDALTIRKIRELVCD